MPRYKTRIVKIQESQNEKLKHERKLEMEKRKEDKAKQDV